MPVALVKIEYNPTGGGTSKVLLPGTDIPPDFPASDIAELTQYEAIGTAQQHEVNQAIAEAERLASLAKSASDAAASAVQQLRSGDAGGAADGGVK